MCQTSSTTIVVLSSRRTMTWDRVRPFSLGDAEFPILLWIDGLDQW
jgi:hypothetical protein